MIVTENYKRVSMVTTSKYKDRAEQIAAELAAAGLDATIVPVFWVCVGNGQYFDARKVIKDKKRKAA